MAVVSTGRKRLLPVVPETGRLFWKQDAHRPVLLGEDQRSQIFIRVVRRTRRSIIDLIITPELGCFGQVRMQSFCV